MFKVMGRYKHMSMLDTSIYVHKVIKENLKDTLLKVSYLLDNGMVIGDSEIVSINKKDNWKWKEIK